MPQRFLRPGILNSEKWNRCGLEAGNLFLRLLTLVDDYGRYDGRLCIIWSQCFTIYNEMHSEAPVMPPLVRAWLAELETHKLIETYEAEGKKVVQITQWIERPRNASRWPSRVITLPVCVLSAADGSRRQLSAADGRLPSPDPLLQIPFPSPSPTPCPPRTREGRAGEERDVEFPHGFPETLEAAQKMAAPLGVLPEVVEKAWTKAASRGGHDAKDVPIRNFSRYLQAEAAYARERQAKDPSKRPGWKEPQDPTIKIKKLV